MWGPPKCLAATTEFHLSIAFSNGFVLFSGIFLRIVTCPLDFTGIVQWIFSGIFQGSFTFVISVV